VSHLVSLSDYGRAVRLQVNHPDYVLASELPAKGRPPDMLSRGTRPNPLVFVLGFGVAIGLLAFSFAHPIHDFVEYWTAAQLLIQHQNPYSLAEVFRMEHAAGFEQSVPIMLLSPPWILPAIAPIGLMHSYGLACLIWMIALISAVAWASRMLMDVYFDELRLPEISDTALYRGMFAFTFFPVLLCLRYSQTAPLMLLGIAGFLYYKQKNRTITAAGFLSLTLIKPHLFYLVWLAVVLRSVRQRQWKLLACTTAFVAAASGVAVLLDPHAFRQYLDLIRNPYMEAYPSGVTAGIRRLLGGVGTFWIQFLPPIAGLGWFAVYWLRHRANWSWTERLPMLLTISVITSAYGWLFDQTVLALPVIALAARSAAENGRLPMKDVALYSVLNCVLMALWPFPTLNVLPGPVLLSVLLSRAAKAKAVPVTPPGLVTD
jgi:Glycosyltransferase family 87